MNCWNPVWEKIHASREWGKYPIEDLIRFVARNYYQVNPRKSVKFLDLGCGEGSATWYLSREGFTVHSIDGAPSAIAKLQNRLQDDGLEASLVAADIINLPYPDDYFDCVVDLVCLTCNDADYTHKILKEVQRILKKGGRFFSYTPRTGCWGDGIGDLIGKNTYKDSPVGPFANMGVVRFSSEEDIENIYGPYFDLSLDYDERSVNGMEQVLSFWAISGVKR